MNILNFHFHDLKTKVFIITGAANGIGRCLATCLAQQGANLILIDKDSQHQEELIENLNQKFKSQFFTSFHCDLAQESEREKTFEAILQAFQKIDGFIHNAGIDPRSPIEKTTMALLHKVFAIKHDTAIHGVQKLLPLLKNSSAGRILLMGSVTNELGSSNLSAYASANAANSGLTRVLAHELGEHNITVNCINPGSIAVEKNIEELRTKKSLAILKSQSIQKQIYPQDLLGLISLLLSESSSCITAQNFTIDGGLIHELSKKSIQNEIVSGTN